MATFMEAMQAAREGKRVRPLVLNHEGGFLDNGFLEWRCNQLKFVGSNRHTALITGLMLDSNWEIEQPPPREYTFMEAVEMMEKGKLMKSLASLCTIKIDENVFKDVDNFIVRVVLQEIKGKWIEVKP